MIILRRKKPYYYRVILNPTLSSKKKRLAGLILRRCDSLNRLGIEGMREALNLEKQAQGSGLFLRVPEVDLEIKD